MTVIYAYHGDTDTLLLPRIWRGISDVRIVEIDTTDDDCEEVVNDAISAEDDTLILCGHGTVHGLLHPDIWSGDYLIHENNFLLIHERNVICVWCHASEFAERVGMNCFCTSMFISNPQEARTYHLNESTYQSIYDSNVLFYERMNRLLIEHVPLNEWVNYFNSNTNPENEVDIYNHQGLRYFHND